MSRYGVVIDSQTRQRIRKATAEEWRRTADGGWEHRDWDDEESGRTVRVSGGPDAEIYTSDIVALSDEAGTHGDYAVTWLCYQALEGDGTDSAWGQCVKVILDTRMRAAEDV
jgi:hypothetical protein